MSRSIFGWDYPPGAANDPNAPWNQVDPPCAICGKEAGVCICPECPTCGAQGDPGCYVEDACPVCGIALEDTCTLSECYYSAMPNHGLRRTPEQVRSLKEAEAQWDEDANRMSLEMERAYGTA